MSAAPNRGRTPALQEVQDVDQRAVLPWKESGGERIQDVHCCGCDGCLGSFRAGEWASGQQHGVAVDLAERAGGGAAAWDCLRMRKILLAALLGVAACTSQQVGTASTDINAGFTALAGACAAAYTSLSTAQSVVKGGALNTVN